MVDCSSCKFANRNYTSYFRSPCSKCVTAKETIYVEQEIISPEGCGYVITRFFEKYEKVPNKKLLQCMLEHPGMSILGISRKLGIPFSTCRRHYLKIRKTFPEIFKKWITKTSLKRGGNPRKVDIVKV